MTDSPNSAESTTTDDRPDHPTTPPSRLPAAQRYWIIIPLLIVLYPVGLVLLVKRRRRGAIRKTLVALATLPAFAACVLLALRPYWAFDGGMRFFLDFGEGGGQSSIVAAHRAKQDKARLATASSEFKDLWYPAFRGPNRDGVVPGNFIALDWTKHPPREMWRQPVGEGWSSFSIGYGNAYTLEQRFGNEAITCYDIATGIERWASEYPAGFTEDLGGDGPRSTPTLYDHRVYALGAEGHLTCVDAETGKQIWQQQINKDFHAENLHWAMSGSPFIYNDTVIVTNSGIGGGSVIAYRLADGKLAWSSDVGQQSYSSPVVASLAGSDQLLNLAASDFNGIDPTNGRKLWSFEFGTSNRITASQPIVIDDHDVFISAGYGVGGVLLDVSRNDGTWTPSERWSSPRMKNKFSSSVYYQGDLYGLDERILACIDAQTGERQWKGGRYNYGSLLLVQGHLLVLGEEGELALVKASPDAYHEVARIKLFDDKTWNNPALVGGLLFARNNREMVCYDLRP